MDFITSSSQHFEIGAFITSTLHTTNTRHREVKELVQGHLSAGDGAGTEESSSQPPPWTDALLLFLCGCHQTEPCSWTGTNIPSSGRKSVSSQVSCTSCPFICSYLASHWCLFLSPATRDWKLNNRQRGRLSGTALHKPVQGVALHSARWPSVHEVWQKPLLSLNWLPGGQSSKAGDLSLSQSLKHSVKQPYSEKN